MSLLWDKLARGVGCFEFLDFGYMFRCTVAVNFEVANHFADMSKLNLIEFWQAAVRFTIECNNPAVSSKPYCMSFRALV